MTEVISFERFCHCVAARLGPGEDRDWDPTSWTYAVSLRDELMMDSFDLLRLGILVEDLAEYFIFELGDIPVPETLGDVYVGYLALVETRASEAEGDIA